MNIETSWMNTLFRTEQLFGGYGIRLRVERGRIWSPIVYALPNNSEEFIGFVAMTKPDFGIPKMQIHEGSSSNYTQITWSEHQEQFKLVNKIPGSPIQQLGTIPANKRHSEFFSRTFDWVLGMAEIDIDHLN